MLLYRYIVKEHLFPFFASLSVIVFLFIMQQAIMMLDRVVSKNIDPLIVLEVFIIQLGWILALGIPMAILCATLMTFGRMAGDNEITAIKASGRSMTALVLPVMAAASVVTVALFYFHDLVLPEANHHAANLLGDISRKRPAAFIEPGVLIRDFQNYALYADEVNPLTGALGGIRVFSDDPGQDPTVTVAESGSIHMTGDGEYIELALQNGETHGTSRRNEREYFAARFKTQVVYIKNIDTRLERTNSGSRGDREMTISEMMAQVRELKESNREMSAEHSRLLDSIRVFSARIDTQSAQQEAGEPSIDNDKPIAAAGIAKPPPKARRDTPARQAKPPVDNDKPAANRQAVRPPPPPPMAGRDAPAPRNKSSRRERGDSLGLTALASAIKSKSAARQAATTRQAPTARPLPTPAPTARPTAARSPANQLKSYEANADRVDKNRRANELLIAQYMVEVHKKFAIPAACLIFVLIGAPLGIMARRGGLAVGSSYSVFFFIVYWVFLITGENMADKLIIPPVVGMWSGNVFLALSGGALMFLMLRETSINFGFLKGFFGKGASLFKSISGLWVFRLPGILFRVPRALLNKANGTLPTYLMTIFAGYAFGLLAALVVIFVTIDYVSNLKKFENASSYYQIVKFYYYYLPWIAQTVLPIVLFLSSMFAMGRIAKTSELTAMKAAGVNVRQLTTPLLFLGLLLAAGVFYGGERVIPRANEQRALLLNAIRTPEKQEDGGPKTIREYRRNFYYFAAPDIMYVFNEFCTEPQFFRGVRRYTFTGNGLAERVDAAETEYDSAGWRFVNGTSRKFTEDGMRAEAFASLPDDVLTAVPLDLVKRVKSKEEMSYWELSSYIEAAKRRGEKVQKFMAELQFKIALPFMNFIVVLFGLSLAARTGRRGGAALFGVGLLLSFLYWILSRFALVFAQNGYIPTLIGAWIGNVIFFLLGIALYRKAAH